MAMGKKDIPKDAKGEKISAKVDKGSVKGVTDESAKGLQGVGNDSKGVREGPRRILSYSKTAHPIREWVRFLRSSVSSC